MKNVQEKISRWSSLWCALMHHDMMWPIHGHYRCATCKRVYSVPW
jgi:hypothetical protein